MSKWKIYRTKKEAISMADLAHLARHGFTLADPEEDLKGGFR